MFFDNNIQKECSTEQNKDIFEDFVANYRNMMLILTYQSAAIRKSKYVQLVDLEYAFNFIYKIFEMLKPWIEESIETTRNDMEKAKAKQQCIYKLKNINKSKAIKIADAINFIKLDMKVSYPTAKAILISFAEEGPYKMLFIDWKEKNVGFI